MILQASAQVLVVDFSRLACDKIRSAELVKRAAAPPNLMPSFSRRKIFYAQCKSSCRLPVVASRLPRKKLLMPSLLHELFFDRNTNGTYYPLSLSVVSSGQRAADSKDNTQNGSSSFQQLVDVSELAAIRTDPLRSKFIRKLSDANQYNRYLLREVSEKERLLQKCKAELSSLERELVVLVNIAQEIAKDAGKPGTRKINGRYIHSHLALRLEECVCALLTHFETWDLDEDQLPKVKSTHSKEAELRRAIIEQMKDIDLIRTREIHFVWEGMAEDVTVMGSFDEWTRGQAMSPESSETTTKFSTTLKLRPGRYEIKFRVDGKWCLSPELPAVGYGVTTNNLLVVE